MPLVWWVWLIKDHVIIYQVGVADSVSYDHQPHPTAPDYIQEPIGSNTYTKQGTTWIKSLR